ncbi:SRPBCC family protein [Gordonia sp. CPCC 205333]|uniref:SRPBCC family protein n=1 Tax=Gordonia sp. CPCC 205333 TaxID=3140790 RepID=UPI003AF36250
MASTFTVVRATVIDAVPDAIFGYLADFHEWAKWTPWEDPELEMTRTYSGPPSGPGAEYSWFVAENGATGFMRMVRTNTPHDGEVHIEFRKPTAVVLDLTYELTAQDAQTDVAWTLVGKHSLMTRAAAATGMLDKIAGKQLDQGLEQLKSVVENGV